MLGKVLPVSQKVGLPILGRKSAAERTAPDEEGGGDSAVAEGGDPDRPERGACTDDANEEIEEEVRLWETDRLATIVLLS